MKVVILAGGLGTRLAEMTSHVPKPMVEIGGKPILWHIMNIFAAHGLKEFIVALGYKGEVIKEFFLNYCAFQSDLRLDWSSGETKIYEGNHPDWCVNLISTGLHTQTGGRIKALQEYIGNETFCMTYGDGVADIDISELIAFHKAHGKLATVTAVRPPARFGGLVLDGAQVTEFTEKNQAQEGWINGGFFVLEPEVFQYIRDEKTMWEREPLEKLAEEGQLMAYFHEGFWQPMDTLRDQKTLQALWESGEAPWTRMNTRSG
ncbi:MAG: glucose-1-phosphate cytidylyltransferase [Verrucomicrobia bacterium]|nr:glucose-1-phosphate cytidylyltransferase [Verrucomicrobiota bacterium]